MSSYKSFKDLNENEVFLKDYSILKIEYNDPEVVIMAPHGGSIEGGTTEIAYNIADSNFNFYAFNGLKSSNNKILHIGSSYFDEPQCLKLISKASITVAIHGCVDKEEIVYAGGKDKLLRDLIIKYLNESGFKSEIPKNPKLAGISENNIVNKNKMNQGVQLEISQGIRKNFFKEWNKKNYRYPKNLEQFNCLNSFGQAIIKAIKEYKN